MPRRKFRNSSQRLEQQPERSFQEYVLNQPAAPLTARRIVVIDIESRRPPYRTREGRFYLRIGEEKREISRSELSNWLDEIRPLSFENVPFASATENDFDDGLLWGFADSFRDDDVL